MRSILTSAAESTIERVAVVVCDFLKKNGGLSNGYATWVQGNVEISRCEILKWCTPKKSDLTGNEVQQLGLELALKIQKILKEEGIERVSIRPRSSEHGCHTIRVVTSDWRYVSFA